MKKLIAVAATALILTGCSPAAPEQSEQVEETPEAAVVEQTPEQAFMEEFDAMVANASDYSDASWLEIADSICDAYEAGATPNQIVDSMQGELEADQAAALVVLSADHLCPEFAP